MSERHRIVSARVASALLAALLAGCEQPPIRPAATHLNRAEAPSPAREAAIPPVEVAPVLPAPRPSVRPETYSVVVDNVQVRELLFALARDAKLNVDIDPKVSGRVTLNAVNQTLMQLLARIARQTDIRYEMVGNNLVIRPDTPYLKAYRVDYVSADRRVDMNSNLSTQFAASPSSVAAPAVSTGTTGSTAHVEVKSDNRLWDTVVENVRQILQETPTSSAAAAAATPAPAGTAAAVPAAAISSAVIANRESGTLFVRATARQHEKIQEFLDQVMSSVTKQVLIEVTVTEVALNDQYQRGIDWNALRTRGAGTFSAAQSSVGTPAGVDTNAFVFGYARTSGNFLAAMKLLESFGTVRVLSSPKLAVLNNQTALLRVTHDIVYFTLTPQQVSVTSPGGTVTVAPSFTTTPNVAAEGFMMDVLPQIGEDDAVVLNIRPTIRRQVGSAADPNPALTTTNNIPVFETREFDSILRVQSGDIAVLGGLMQDETRSVEDGIPFISDIPVLGWLFKQKKDITTKTELVIFLRPTVIHDGSIAGDFSRFRDHLPTERFFDNPAPARRPPAAKP